MPQFDNTLINRFDGGISNDKRFGWVRNGSNFTTNRFSITKHFDALTYPNKLVPYKITLADETKSYDIVKFLVAPYETTSTRLYGFGVSTSTYGAVYIHNASLVANGWTISQDGATNNTSGRFENAFEYYKDYLYWFAGTTALMRYDTATSGSHNVTRYQVMSDTISTVAQPVHHPADDILYLFTNNYVHKINDTVFTEKALTLPSDMKIVCACPFGNYLAIACTSKQTYNKRNIVFLWDRDSSITTLTERIDFGDGEIKHLANLNNKLTAVMSFYLYSVANISLNKAKILIKQADGNYGRLINEIVTDDDVDIVEDLPDTRFVDGNKLYFPAKAPLDSDDRLGIWAVDEYGRATLDFIEEDATSYEGIYRVGNQWWIAHSDDGSVNKSKYNDTAYSFTSIYETLVFNAGDSHISKKLVGAGVMFEKLPSAGSVALKYRIDGDTSWTTIFTHTTDDTISHEAVNIEDTGANLPEFKEIEFRIESTGGVEITGLKFKAEIMDKNLF